MAKVLDVANLFIYLSNNTPEEFITNLKLNILLYFTQGEYLAKTGNTLFSDEIEAWKYGPVVPEIYREYKSNGSHPIDYIDEVFSENNLSLEEINIISDVMIEYGKYQTSYLVGLTHCTGTPWDNIYNENDQNKTIPIEEMKSYFTNHSLCRPLSLQKYADSHFIGYRDEEGYLVLPSEEYYAEDDD